MTTKYCPLTFTEFGRRAKSNDSYGTDHGTATPVFVFGTQLNNGIYGVNPLLDEDTMAANRNNLVYNNYRRIYTSVIQDWFEGDNEALIQTGFADWVNNKLPIVNTTGIDSPYTPGKNPTSLHLYPNPVKDQLQIQVQLELRGELTFHVIDSAGRKVKSIHGEGVFGPNSYGMDVSDLENGLYHLQMIHRGQSYSSKFLKL